MHRSRGPSGTLAVRSCGSLASGAADSCTSDMFEAGRSTSSGRTLLHFISRSSTIGHQRWNSMMSSGARTGRAPRLGGTVMLHPDTCDQVEEAHVRGVELRGCYRGNNFSIVTDYDTASHRWPVQVFINGAKCRGHAQGNGSTLIEAEEWGLSAVEREIDARLRTAASLSVRFVV